MWPDLKKKNKCAPTALLFKFYGLLLLENPKISEARGLGNKNTRLRTGEKRAGKSNFGCFMLNKTPVWLCMVARWCPMQFGEARWLFGGQGWSMGAVKGFAWWL